MKTRNYILLSPVLVLLCTASVNAQLYESGQATEVYSESVYGLSLDGVEQFNLPARSNATLMAKATAFDDNGPTIMADPFVVNLATNEIGTFETTDNGEYAVWRLLVTSNEAKHLNFGFSKYQMPVGGQLNFYSMINDDFIGPFTSADNEAHGELWTPVLFSDQVLIEAIVPSDKLDELRLELKSINHGFRDFGETFGLSQKGTSGSCNVDVNCPDGDSWRAEIAASGVYGFNGSTFCSGSLINNARQDQTPYFLTANHCGVNQSNAPSVVVYWNFLNSTCRTPGSADSGGNGDGTLNQFNSGAQWVAAYDPSDFTLLRLDDPVDPTFELGFSGWDRRDIAPSQAIAIHHPNTGEMRISFEFDPTSITPYLSAAVNPSATHIRIADWDTGTTEPGSSGSPLYSPENRIVGQLEGGFAACGNDDDDWYGRIFSSWTGGNTPTSRLSDWLDPDNNGAEFIDTLAPGLDFNVQRIIEITEGTNADGDGLYEPGETLELNVGLINKSIDVVDSVNLVIGSDSPTIGFSGTMLSTNNLAISPDDTPVFPFPTIEVTVSNDHPCDENFSLLFDYEFDFQSEILMDSRTTSVDVTDQCNFLPEPVVATPALDDSSGNNDGVADPNEAGVQLLVPFSNTGAPTPQWQAELILNSPFVSGSLNDSGSYSGNNAMAAFSLDFAPQVPCPSVIDSVIRITSGNRVIDFPYQISVGTFPLVELTESPGIVYGDTGLARIVQIPFDVNQSGPLEAARVTVDIDHTWVSDNVITLISPAGTEVVLVNSTGGNGDNFDETTFTDDAANSIAGAGAPFTGSFRPLEPLSTLIGEEISGTWIVEINDSVDLDDGTINRVDLALEFEGQSCAILTGPFQWSISHNGADVLCCDTIIPVLNLQDSTLLPIEIQVVNNGTNDIILSDFEFSGNLTMDDMISDPLVIPSASSETITLIHTDAMSGDEEYFRFKSNDPINKQTELKIRSSNRVPVGSGHVWDF